MLHSALAGVQIVCSSNTICYKLYGYMIKCIYQKYLVCKFYICTHMWRTYIVIVMDSSSAALQHMVVQNTCKLMWHTYSVQGYRHWLAFAFEILNFSSIIWFETSKSFKRWTSWFSQNYWCIVIICFIAPDLVIINQGISSIFCNFFA